MAVRARALGGTLTLSHAPGGGTVVAIRIKRENRHGAHETAAPPSPAAPGSATIGS
jgi:hypothetical protein